MKFNSPLIIFTYILFITTITLGLIAAFQHNVGLEFLAGVCGWGTVLCAINAFVPIKSEDDEEDEDEDDD